MEPINIERIQALRKQQNSKALMLVALSSCIFCTAPFWIPSLYSSTKTFFCVSIPKLTSLFFNAKSLFILGNLIVIFLVRDSKLQPKEVDEMQTVLSSSSKTQKIISKRSTELTSQDNGKKNDDKIASLELCNGEEDIAQMDEEERESLGTHADELKRRADDFIARVNKQIRLESLF